MPSHPFDAAASDYDQNFTDRPPGRWFRDTVWAYMKNAFQEGGHVLDLGCGTGEDAVWLALQGIHVTALDASENMLQVAREKADREGVSDLISFIKKDLAAWEKDDPAKPLQYDGVLSNFGALNCLEDLGAFAEKLSRRIRPGGLAFFVVMGPVCPWEMIWYLLHGRVNTAFRRFHRTTKARVGQDGTVQVRYPTPPRFRSHFLPFFKPVRIVGIGALLPPPYMSHMVEKAEGFFRRVASLERRMGPHFPWTWLNDHYLVILKRA